MREIFKILKNNRAKIIHFVIIIAVMAILTFINKKFYGSAYNLLYIWPLGLITLGILILFNKKISISYSASISLLIVAIMLIVFVIHKPLYSVKRARRKITRELGEEVIYNKNYSNTTKKAGKYIDRYYIYKIDDENWAIFDPESSEYIIQGKEWIEK